MKIDSVERTIDGDTIVVILDLNFGVYIQKHLRLYGIDCPEKNTEAGKKVKMWVERWINENSQNLQLEVIDYEDKYGRLLTKIKRVGKDGEVIDLVDLLLESGLGKPYSGKGARGWTEDELLLVENSEVLKGIDVSCD